MFLTPSGDQFLLHGDLHHDNILLGESGVWRVIDPQGVVGAPVLECGRFIQNHVVGENDRLDLQKAHAAIGFLAEVIEQPVRQVWIAFFILHILTFSWGYEMNYESRLLKKGEDECAATQESIPI